ncbi:MAG: hypothetical protein E7181_05580 [Erysipelotrichaceae bacterium]|nr:hypothetical protein [Erysipelotrichaceae bacterium]
MNRKKISLLPILATLFFVVSCGTSTPSSSESSKQENIYQKYFDYAEEYLAQKKEIHLMEGAIEEYSLSEDITIYSSDRMDKEVSETISLSELRKQNVNSYDKKQYVFYFYYIGLQTYSPYIYLNDFYNDYFNDFLLSAQFKTSDPLPYDITIYSKEQEYHVNYDGTLFYQKDDISYASIEHLSLAFLFSPTSAFYNAYFSSLVRMTTILDHEVDLEYQGERVNSINFNDGHLAGYRTVGKEKVDKDLLFGHYHIDEDKLIKISRCDKPDNIAYLDLNGNLLCNVSSRTITGYRQIHAIVMTDMIDILHIDLDMDAVLSLFNQE